ncbi:cytochrome b5 domain-containing protein [Desertimonas flava]|uniref:cytochrome b5 domain-containing protein n=1 Tax=Desertimonas flava TaxID=2064846 RepID=UPI0023F3F8D1|nr:cytochrome b5 domain-containing protein [Desertimonas flava]
MTATAIAPAPAPLGPAAPGPAAPGPAPTGPATPGPAPATVTRSSPKTGTVLPTGRPFWIVDGEAYDFTEWIGKHPGGATWFTQTIGRDISALLHTYHPEPAGLQKMLARFKIRDPRESGQFDELVDDVRPEPPRGDLVGDVRSDAAGELPGQPMERPAPPPVPTAQDILPKLGVPPFLLAPDFDARRDLPHLDYRDEGSLLADIRRTLFSAISRQQLRRWDRLFDGVTWAIGIAHIATLVLLIIGVLPAWAFVVLTVLTRTALAGAGHYQVHRKWRTKPKGRRPALPLAKALFDINYVGTSLIGTDGHVLLHHPYMGSGADVKKTFFDAMLRLHPLLRVPGYTIHKLGIALTGLSMRGREIAQFERPQGVDPGDHASSKERRAAAREQGDDAPAADTRADKKQAGADAARVDFWLVRALLLIELGLCLATGHILAWFVQFFVTLWFNTFLVVSSHDFEEATTDEDELAGLPQHLRNDWAAQQIWLSYDLTVVGNRWIDLFLSAGLSPHRVHHVVPWQGSGFANLVSEGPVREACERAGIPWQRPRNLIFDRFPKVIKHYLFCPAKVTPAAPAVAPPAPGNGPTPPPVPPTPAEPAAPSRLTVRSQLGEFVRYAAGGFRGVGV